MKSHYSECNHKDLTHKVQMLYALITLIVKVYSTFQSALAFQQKDNTCWTMKHNSKTIPKLVYILKGNASKEGFCLPQLVP